MSDSTVCPPNLDNILDLPVMLTVELGSCRKTTRELLGLGLGSVVELDPREGREVDIYAGPKLVARGQIVVAEESLAVKVIEVFGGK
ncbi:MAG TPA: FliM/FliN family flagellar motor switch protein [Verrucomicrobiae bacterium]|jgi:flagellar motor switch protein FliN/FliY|nr:FliM/FliN family flagellar motor switch protein [Verrucomicrobiae bacterium]